MLNFTLESLKRFSKMCYGMHELTAAPAIAHIVMTGLHSFSVESTELNGVAHPNFSLAACVPVVVVQHLGPVSCEDRDSI